MCNSSWVWASCSCRTTDWELSPLRLGASYHLSLVRCQFFASAESLSRCVQLQCCYIRPPVWHRLVVCGISTGMDGRECKTVTLSTDMCRCVPRHWHGKATPPNTVAKTVVIVASGKLQRDLLEMKSTVQGRTQRSMQIDEENKEQHVATSRPFKLLLSITSQKNQKNILFSCDSANTKLLAHALVTKRLGFI